MPSPSVFALRLHFSVFALRLHFSVFALTYTFPFLFRTYTFPFLFRTYTFPFFPHYIIPLCRQHIFCLRFLGLNPIAFL